MRTNKTLNQINDITKIIDRGEHMKLFIEDEHIEIVDTIINKLDYLKSRYTGEVNAILDYNESKETNQKIYKNLINELTDHYGKVIISKETPLDSLVTHTKDKETGSLFSHYKRAKENKSYCAYMLQHLLREKEIMETHLFDELIQKNYSEKEALKLVETPEVYLSHKLDKIKKTHCPSL